MEKQIAMFNKNATEEIIVKLTEFEGKNFIDIRAYVKPLTSRGELIPTKKGICMKVETVAELLTALKKVEKVYKEELEKRAKETAIQN